MTDGKDNAFFNIAFGGLDAVRDHKILSAFVLVPQTLIGLAELKYVFLGGGVLTPRDIFLVHDIAFITSSVLGISVEVACEAVSLVVRGIKEAKEEERIDRMRSQE